MFFLTDKEKNDTQQNLIDTNKIDEERDDVKDSDKWEGGFGDNDASTDRFVQPHPLSNTGGDELWGYASHFMF